MGLPRETAEGCRTLHWALKVGNLKESLRFFDLVFGLRILRHEEFESGNDDAAGRAYHGAYSKTTVGYGGESTNFVLELCYRYGSDRYDGGDALIHFCVACPAAAERATAFGYAVAYERGMPIVRGPDGVAFRVVSPTRGRGELWSCVVLKCGSIKAVERYYCDVLGFTRFPGAPPGCAMPVRTVCVGFNGEDQCRILFAETGGPADHGSSVGRLAIACDDVGAFYTAAAASGIGAVRQAPVALDGGDIDRVALEFAVLADPDGYELAVLGAEAFYDLAHPSYDGVDWNLREARGADGNEPPARSGDATAFSPSLSPVGDSRGVAKVAAGNALTVLCFFASWCRTCEALRPHVERLSEGTVGVSFALVDVDESNPELKDEYGVSSVPHLVFLAGGKTVGSYVGGDEVALEAEVASCLLDAMSLKALASPKATENRAAAPADVLAEAGAAVGERLNLEMPESDTDTKAAGGWP